MIFGTRFLSCYSRILVILTFFLIFAGSMVTSTQSGLAVPDWPLSYGMLFPPMVGGVFYEHGHRLVAATVGFLTLVFFVLVLKFEPRVWVKKLSFLALLAVVLQGLLGGITVLFYLPLLVSTAHALLGQTFFLITLFLAYAYSFEFAPSAQNPFEKKIKTPLYSRAVVLLILVYVQLLLGALMRHSESGLALLDFPAFAGSYWPQFGEETLRYINQERYNLNLDPIHFWQLVSHVAHRLGALVVFLYTVYLINISLKSYVLPQEKKLIGGLGVCVGIQLALGASVIWFQKQPLVTSLHVLTGAFILGLAALLVMRTRLKLSDS